MSQNTEKARQAVAYLLTQPEERPEELKRLLIKLEKYGQTGQSIDNAITQARQSLDKLYDEMSQLKGSINAVYEMTIEEMTDEQVEKINKEIPVPEVPGPKKEEGASEEKENV